MAHKTAKKNPPQSGDPPAGAAALSSQLQLPPRYLLIALFPVLAFLIMELAQAVFAAAPVFDQNTFVSGAEVTFKSPVEAAHRMRVIGMSVLLIATSLAIAVSFEIRRRACDPNTRFWLLAGVAACTAVGIAVAISTAYGDRAGQAGPSAMHFMSNFDALGANVFEQAFLLSSHYLEGPGRLFFRTQVGAGVVFVSVAISALIMDAISTLATERNAAIDERKAYWRSQVHRLQLITYVATALLVVGLLYLQSWAQWPMFAFADGPAGQSSPDLTRYAGLVSAMLQFTGIEYSLILAAFVLPVSYVLNQQANALAAEDLNARTKAPRAYTLSEILRERSRDDLLVPFSDYAKAIAAVMAPFVAGTLNNVLGSL